MGVCMMLWAVVSALTALAKDFKGLLLTRFFLGVTEAPYYPGAVYLLSMFCKSMPKMRICSDMPHTDDSRYPQRGRYPYCYSVHW